MHMNVEDFKHHYDAIVKEVYDGDTITVDLDLGMDIWLHNQKLRLCAWDSVNKVLRGIDAPEVRGPEKPQGIRSRDWLRSQIEGKTITIRTYKDRKGKYGRWLADILTVDGVQLADSMGNWMVRLGMAHYEDY